MSQSIKFRPMKKEDLPQVMDVQKKTFGADLCEDYEVFLNRFDVFGQYFKVVMADDEVVGYMVCFPWKLGESPVNNQKFPDVLPKFDCFYLHDIALLKSQQGRGLAQKLISYAFQSALELGHQSLSLVSVKQSGDYWDKRGFTPLDNISPKKLEFIQLIYGAGARLMVTSIER